MRNVTGTMRNLGALRTVNNFVRAEEVLPVLAEVPRVVQPAQIVTTVDNLGAMLTSREFQFLEEITARYPSLPCVVNRADDFVVLKGKVPQSGVPYKPLTPSQRFAIQSKINARTATADEWTHLQWDRRFGNRRDRGVSRFWSQERRRLRNGEDGTRNWALEQIEAILKGKTPSHNGEAMERHHIWNALDHPHIADDPLNIFPATYNETFSGGMQGIGENDTFGWTIKSVLPT